MLLFYQQYYNYTNIRLSELIDSKVFSLEFFDIGRKFLIILLENKNFLRLTIDEIKLEALKIKTINNSIINFFYQKPDFFISEDIQQFYQISTDFEKLVALVILNITVNFIGISSSEIKTLDFLQKKYRSYILNIFWPKFYRNLTNENKNNVFPREGQTKYAPSWNVEILYNKPKINHFHFISSQFQLYTSKKENYKKGRLSFYGEPNRLLKIKDPIYTHNMIVKEINPKLDFSINQKDNIYYLKYDINTMIIENVRKIFVYGYIEHKQKKIFIGFSYRDNEHYRNIYRKYYQYLTC
jgi:hypothetical protein